MLDTVNRLLRFQVNSEEHLKSLQKQKYLNELSSLTDRPTISPNSKKLSKNSSPFYIRSNLEAKAKDARLNKLRQIYSDKQEQVFLKNCPFVPNKISCSERKHSEIVEHCFQWKENRKKNLRISQEMKFVEEARFMKTKPSISENSKRIAEGRSSTPVLKRLTEQRELGDFSVDKGRNWKYVNEKSKRLLEEKTKEDGKKEYLRNGSFIKFHALTDFCKTFKVNTSRSTVNVVDVNFVEFENLAEILNRNN